MTELRRYLANNPKKYLIFDFDLTLFKLHLPWGIYLDKTHQILREYNQNFYDEHQSRDWTNYELINAFVKEFGVEPRDRALAYGCTFEKERLERVSEHKELTNFVKENQGKYEMFVWSSNCSSTIKPILAAQNLDGCFKFLATRDILTCTKPEIDGFIKISEYLTEQTSMRTEIAPSDFLMIGDSGSDEGAARSAGIDFFKVAYF